MKTGNKTEKCLSKGGPIQRMEHNAGRDGIYLYSCVHNVASYLSSILEILSRVPRASVQTVVCSNRDAWSSVCNASVLSLPMSLRPVLLFLTCGKLVSRARGDERYPAF